MSTRDQAWAATAALAESGSILRLQFDPHEGEGSDRAYVVSIQSPQGGPSRYYYGHSHAAALVRAAEGEGVL